jgi:hypothetical protein
MPARPGSLERRPTRKSLFPGRLGPPGDRPLASDDPKWDVRCTPAADDRHFTARSSARNTGTDTVRVER